MTKLCIACVLTAYRKKRIALQVQRSYNFSILTGIDFCIDGCIIIRNRTLTATIKYIKNDFLIIYHSENDLQSFSIESVDEESDYMSSNDVGKGKTVMRPGMCA
jgi:hypothetical protein